MGFNTCNIFNCHFIANIFLSFNYLINFFQVQTLMLLTRISRTSRESEVGVKVFMERAYKPLRYPKRPTTGNRPEAGPNRRTWVQDNRNPLTLRTAHTEVAVAPDRDTLLHLKLIKECPTIRLRIIRRIMNTLRPHPRRLTTINTDPTFLAPSAAEYWGYNPYLRISALSSWVFKNEITTIMYI